MNEVPESSVVLFEDIDCMATGHRTGERGDVAAQGRTAVRDDGQDRFGVTLSGLLNVLDGFHAPENVVYVMTTNDADSLDSALLRPGRIDYKLHMGNAGDQQKVELYMRFFPGASLREATRFAEEHRAETMADFQGLLLRLDQGCQDQTVRAAEEPEGVAV